ncbi:GNAT family N-acetyltransferase [Paenibacillus sacheonensis]|uniref:GNAT family N-acetyltransferase n=1 Tax=Paenibacillus sacheonensis TaxID=742054 RepID=A0A7X4YKA8_9BACL|nr:GNAT family N-acetyltransferase [Paenibacillus sacheonensis]MBM7563687.1 GNAT superfamily N-acetyltransferase [Paenibacillus sacheonensis]NBC67955.1 GNAT family N-acetyltransferase [Paenibacillus sacheonensis]
MLTFKRSSNESLAAEREILNANPLFNRLSKDKEILSLADIEAEHREAEAAGAERYVMHMQEHPAGILEYLMINPKDSCTWIGLLVIHGSHQGKGLARAALKWFDDRMQAGGVVSHRLGVLEDNHPAHAFWRSQGASPVKPAVLPDGKPILIYERNVQG